MFPHLFNSLSVVIPVLSSTFASVGRFLKHAGNMSLGMLIIDESGQAVPQSALGAIYRTRRAVVVGDPLQVEPVVTIPKVLIDILADSTCVANAYKVIENSVQTWTTFEAIISFKRVVFPVPGGPFTENIFSFLSFSDIAMFIAICCINVGENFDGYFPIGNLSTSNHFFILYF